MTDPRSARPPRTVLVTGGNRGLGYETCRQLAARGLRVFLASRSAQGPAAAARLVAEGFAVTAVPLDVTADASVAALADRLRRDGVTLDVLVNNAGIYEDDPALAPTVLAADFAGPRRVTRALLPLMPDGGHVVMVSSGMGELADFPPALRDALLRDALTEPDVVSLMERYLAAAATGRPGSDGWPASPYVVAKAGLNALVRVLARELAGRRIRVNAVCPGWVRTDMGGPGAPRDVATGAGSIVALAGPPDGPTGGFFRDGKPIDW